MKYKMHMYKSIYRCTDVKSIVTFEACSQERIMQIDI